MAAPTNYYCDPSVAAGGVGTEVDPVDTVQNTVARILVVGRDAINGDQINVVEGTDDTPAAVIDLATVGAVYGNPAVDAPLNIRGCRRDPITGLPVANNGGIGGMDGGANGFSIYDGNAGATDYVNFIHMHLHNTAAARVMRFRDYSMLYGCEVDNTTAFEGVGLAPAGNSRNVIAHNYFHDCATYGVYGGGWRDKIVGNYCDVAAGSTGGIYLASLDNLVWRNMIVVNEVAANGILVSQSNQWLIGNTIFSTVAATAAGILFDAATHDSMVILDNLIEGFSGVGGRGIDFANLTRHVQIYENNSFHDNETDEDNRGDFDYEAGNDLAMAASPLMKEGAMTFANRFNYFKPAIPVRGGAFPTGCRFDRGAVQVRLAIEREIPATVVTTIPARTVLDPL